MALLSPAQRTRPVQAHRCACPINSASREASTRSTARARLARQIEEDWAHIRADYGDPGSRRYGYIPPDWPNSAAPQQMHVDLAVDDLDIAEAAVIELGAVKHLDQPGTTFRVFLDPAGHFPVRVPSRTQHPLGGGGSH